MSENSVKSSCRIAVDAMGGDFAPDNAVMGAVVAQQGDSAIEIYLLGIKEKILEVLKKNSASFPVDRIIDCPQVIEMEDIPTVALKAKPESSIVIGAKMVKNGKADAFVSAGNTGAMMAASTLLIGRINGVGRPTIGAPMPSEKGFTLLLDVGASVDSKPQHLLEYAILGTIYAKEIYGISNPSIGILSVGSEDVKGNEMSLAAFKLLKDSGLNFYGNVEGKDILKGTVNIVICDGFVGNILLKFAEGVLSLLKYKLKNYAEKSIIRKLKLLMFKSSLKGALSDMDAESHGGVPLLGVNGISIIGHGSSSVLAIKNMILRAKEMHHKEILRKFEESLERYGRK
ncbi:MAG: phosphate acyltransferase PlsX [Ignavibacteria bacterium]|nr:phosphate acyltransferase PlsX [Ignavibacteria bacterium]